MAACSSFVSFVSILQTSEKPPHRLKVNFDIRKLMFDSSIWRFLVVSFIFGLGSTSATSLFSFITVGKLKMTVWQVASAATLNLAFNVISQRSLGRIIDRFGRRPVIVFSRVAICSSCFVYAFASSWVHIVLVEGLIGIALAAWSTGQATYIIDIAPSELRATYLAMGMTAVGVSTFIGAYVGGIIFQMFLMGDGYTGISLGLIIAGFLRVALGLLFISIRETKKVDLTQH
jgi:MFS family permease